MPSQYLAQNRFGLGWRSDDPQISDVKNWLMRQLANFDPAPKPIAELPTRHAIAAAYVAHRDRPQSDSPSNANMVRTNLTAMKGGYAQAVSARVISAVHTSEPFPERLTHFWSNHFAVSTEKLPVQLLAGNFEFEAIRPHIMGSFADLLIAAVRHPAMLTYLDQIQSYGPNSTISKRVAARGDGKKAGLNENLAREILELHTLGVRTNYTQADVTSLANALTGLTVVGIGRGAWQQSVPPNLRPGDTVFIELLQEPGPQTIMGKRYDSAGATRSEAVLRDLAVHPSTARHIATKLARHFSGDAPPSPLIDRLTSNFVKTRGDLPSLYKTLLASPEPWATSTAMFKSPWDWSVSLARALDVRLLGDDKSMAGMFAELGQPVWRPGSPAGYDDKILTWAGAAGLMSRIAVASRVGRSANYRGNAQQLAALALADALDPQTREAIRRADSSGQSLAILFSCPAFLKR